MITFKKVRWKNFLQTGNDFIEVDLCTYRNTLIVGPNGSGKSTLIDAICFALFNRPFRKVTKALLTNSITNKGTVVEVELNARGRDYLIRRGAKPNLFEVYRDGVLASTDSADYQQIIDGLTRSHKSFCQIAVLGSANYTPFMHLSAADRRSLVEDVLDCGVCTDMSRILKDRIKENDVGISAHARAIEVVRAKLDTHMAHVVKARTNNDQLVADKEYELEEIGNDLKDAEEQIARLREKESELSGLRDENAQVQSRYIKLCNIRDQLNDKADRIRSSASFYHDNDTCPTCNQDISSSLKEEVLAGKEAKICELEKAVVQITRDIDACKKEIENLAPGLRELDVIRRNVQTNESVRQNAQYRIRTIERDIKALREGVESVDEGLEQAYRTELDEKKAILKTYLDQKEVYAAASTLLADDGIKASIVKRYIPVINRSVNEFLARMGFFVDFQLDESFSETIRSRHRDKFVHESFSEGQKDRIDLALLFAWREVARVKNSMSTNLLIMDEIFDGSMDDQGVEEMMRFLTDLRGTNTVIISHSQNLAQEKFDRVLRFSTVKNFSRMEVVS